jgi:ABC-2 type transport system ATP-binding protein
VLTTHYMDEAEVLADRIAIIDNGRLLVYDTPTELINRLDAPTRITLPDGEMITTRDPAAEIARLSQANRLDGVRVQTGTLDDVFLDLTGREYRA